MRHPDPAGPVAAPIARSASSRGRLTVGGRKGWRLAIGFLVSLGGLLVVGQSVWDLGQQAWQAHPELSRAWRAGWVAAFATASGTLPACWAKAPSARSRDAMMGFGAGVMLAASVFSLIVPALSAAADQGHGPWGRSAVVGTGVWLGALLIMALERVMPPVSTFAVRDSAARAVGVSPTRLRRVWLFVAAVALHNVPEGLAMGVAQGGSDVAAARALATGIAIQDIPEGLVIASALLSAGHGRALSVGLGALSGVVEPLAALAAAGLTAWSVGLLPWGLSLAAGAMLFVISHEVIPETHRHGHARGATTGLMLGFVLMMVLDTAMG